MVISGTAFSDEAFDFYVEACRHSGDNPGEISTFQAELSVVTQTLFSDSERENAVKKFKEHLSKRVDDDRRNDHDQRTFMANKPGELDLQTIEKKNLDTTPWLTPKRVKQYTPPPIEKAEYTWLRIVFMSAGIILIILGLTRRFFRK